MPAVVDVQEGLWKDWDARGRFRPLLAAMALAGEGLVLGAGTVLAKRKPGNSAPELDLDGAEPRILALLAAAYGRPVPPSVLGNIRRASVQWNRGNTALAYVHLAHAGLAKLEPGEDAPRRLFLAEGLLEAGIEPDHLLKALGIDATPLALLKAGYQDTELRIPRGHGLGSGEWTRDGSHSLFQPARAKIDYEPTHPLPGDAVAVTRPDGTAVENSKSPNGKLMAPPWANFHRVYAAGKAIASRPLAAQIPEIRAAVAQGGLFDFQRDVISRKLRQAYTPASNYAVGVFMAGAGHSLVETLSIAEGYAFFNSKNYGDKDQIHWIIQGWKDARNGTWQ